MSMSSYIDFQSKLGNWLGKRTYQFFLVLNGIVGPWCSVAMPRGPVLQS